MASRNVTDAPEIRGGPDLSANLTRGVLALWAREGKWTDIAVSGVSMTPLIPDGSTLTVRFGRDGLVVGDVVLYTSGDRIIAHRVLRLGRGGRRWGYLKVKGDPLHHGEAAWIPVEDVVGRVVALRRPDGRTLLLNDTLGRLANRTAALVSGLPARVEGKARALVGARRPLRITPALLGLLHPLYLWGGRKRKREMHVLIGDEERLILASARPRFRNEDRARVASLLRGELVWNRVVGVASSLGLAPLLYRNLANPDLGERVPRAALEALRRSAHAAACRAAIQLEALEKILAAFRDQGMDPVLLKGVALALTLYDQAALRPMQDIDLLLEPSQVPLAVRTLELQGFMGVDNGLTDAFYAGHHHVRPMAGPAGRVIVEIHRGLVPPEDGLSLDPALFLKRTVRIETGAGLCRVLAREDQLLHACLHLSYADRFIGRLRDLVDVHALVESGDRPPDWGRTLESAGSPEVSRSLYSTLKLSRSLLGTAIPEAVLSELSRGSRWDPLARALVHILGRSNLFRVPPSEKLLSPPAARWMCDALIKRSGWAARGIELVRLLHTTGNAAS